MGWNAADIPDLTGKVAVVTGGNGGLGLEVARELARKRAHVVIAARDAAKTAAARAAITTEIPDASLEIHPLDLASLDSVVEAAAAVLREHEVVDVLVNNAGVMATPEQQTRDGFEMQFGVNHLGHFALTALLWPSLLASDGARGDLGDEHRTAPRASGGPGNPHMKGSYDPWRAYGQSKLANALRLGARPARARGAPAREEPRGARGVRQHGSPGGACADPGRPQPALLPRPRASERHDAGARFALLLRAATDPKAEGGTCSRRDGVTGAPVRRPLFGRSRGREAMATLWEISEGETGIVFEVATSS